MTRSKLLPPPLKDGFVDAMGRVYSAICKFTDRQPLPIGTRVKIHSAGARCFSKYYDGKEAVVTGPLREGHWGMMDPRVPVRFVEPQEDWEIGQNYKVINLCDAEVLAVGDGTLIPGISYRLCEQELWDARFAAYDFTFQEYRNYPTFLAALYLRQDYKHVEAVRTMRRKDGTVNPVRLEKYFAAAPDLRIEESEMYQGDFPARTIYRQSVDWAEVANDFNVLFKEEDAYA